MIDIRDLLVERDGRKICTVPRLTVEAGAWLGLIGSNGSGKSTLLRALDGLIDDYSGQCTVDASRRERTFVHQDPLLFRGTVVENAAFGLRCRGVSRKEAHRRAVEWLERLGVGGHAERTGAGLSAGERRRVALARGLAVEPRLLLLDEPFSDLDADGIESLRQVLSGLDGTTVVLTSPVELADTLMSSTYAMNS